MNKFKALNTDVVVVVPNGPRMIARHIRECGSPYLLLSDKGSKVAAQYHQAKKYFSAGTPTVFVVDRSGYIAYAYYATSLTDEPDNEEPLAVLANLEAEHR